MNVIIIGAGRGARIMPYSKDAPKCFTEISGKRIIDYSMEAFRKSNPGNLHFIGGYLIEVVKKEYPNFVFHHNIEWEHNNILASLFYAQDAMKDGFISSYSDIIYTPEIIKKVFESRHDITLAIDTDWKSRYKDRSQHPMDDAEKVLFEGAKIKKISRKISNDGADGEFIGVAKFTPKGAQKFIKAYHEAKQKYEGKPFHEASVFKKSYLIHLLEEMLENGEEIHFVPTHGGYYEIDTVEDIKLASESISTSGQFKNE